ncbi:hypothetical protein VTO42DRAFT_8001 [Malbranchea cinnamomea]
MDTLPERQLDWCDIWYGSLYVQASFLRGGLQVKLLLRGRSAALFVSVFLLPLVSFKPSRKSFWKGTGSFIPCTEYYSYYLF